MSTSIILAPKATRGKLCSATNGLVTNTSVVNDTWNAMILHAVKHNVNDKMNGKQIASKIGEVLRANIEAAFGDQAYYKAEFNLRAPKTSKGAYGLECILYPFALRKDKTVILPPTVQCLISRTKAWILKSDTLSEWESLATNDDKYIRTQPDSGTKATKTKATRKRPQFGQKVAAAYGDAVAAKINTLLEGDKAGTYVTKAVFDKRVASFLKALDTALAA